MVITSNRKGQLAVSKAEMRPFELGYIPSRPLYDARYDLIIDDSRKLQRIQVKYANGQHKNMSGVVIVKLEYEDRQKKCHTYQKDEVDALVVYIPKIDRLCYFPHKIFLGKRKLSVRLEKPKNNYKHVIYAKDFLW
jgi:hypothetical protein